MSNFKLDPVGPTAQRIKLGRDEVGWVQLDRASNLWRGNALVRGNGARVQGFATAANAFYAVVRLVGDLEFSKYNPECKFMGIQQGLGSDAGERQRLNQDTTDRVNARNEVEPGSFRVVRRRR